jgi:hypothetical protein
LPGLQNQGGFRRDWSAVLAKGDALVRNKMRTPYRHAEVLGNMQWGVASHELSRLESYRILDQFGQEQCQQVEETPRSAG